MNDYGNSSSDITVLLLDWRGGNRDALDRLLPIVYGELHKIADYYMYGEKKGHTLQPTAVVNEAYMKLVNMDHMNWGNRAHFFSIAARIIRNILIDYARGKKSQKRGGKEMHVTIEGVDAPRETRRELLELDETLNLLEEISPRQGRVIELSFFGGLTKKEIAEVMDLSEATVYNELKTARAWLFHKLKKR
ncbi:MAG: sigma-70 family RNA polymerase sigma factor [bacterium]|nr:sigma-70 family RNA polymerase sigma factor [bacterium]